jgi:hypothetical protein
MRTKANTIPLTLNDLALNLRAYCELPPRGESLEAEVNRLMALVAAGRVSQTEAAQAVLRIVGRELDLFAEAVRAALPHGYRMPRDDDRE